jgi:hypothetical protein
MKDIRSIRSRMLANPFLLVSPALRWIWLGMLLSATWMTVAGWFAALDIGSPIFIQAGLVMFGASLGDVVAVLRYERRAFVVHMLYVDGIVFGMCEDRGDAISEVNSWKWYRLQGSPWRIKLKGERPHVRTVDVLARLDEIDKAFNRERARGGARTRR